MKTKPIFQTIIGVDQTGATVPGTLGTRTRPLAWAVVRCSGNSLQLTVPHERLQAFHLHEIEKSVKAEGNTAALVDCVLGLPVGAPRWEHAMSSISRLPRRFGRNTAEAFFSSLLPEASSIPTRLCEEIAKANSVFRSRPFQKNIQTGTFRIWMDLASDPRNSEWLIWPYSRTPGKFMLFEGYPSLLWRTLAKQNSRAPTKLPDWLSTHGVRFSAPDARRFKTDPDLADAVMLAVGGAILQRQGNLLDPFPGFFQSQYYRNRAHLEGWIAGLQKPS